METVDYILIEEAFAVNLEHRELKRFMFVINGDRDFLKDKYIKNDNKNYHNNSFV